MWSSPARRNRSRDDRQSLDGVEIVFTHPPVYLGLCILDTVEHLVGKELLAQRLMPTLNLACRCRRPRSGQNMFDTDPVKQDLTRPGAESAGEHLPVVGQDLLRDTMSCHCYTRHTPVEQSPAHHQTETMNLEWSSIPDTTKPSNHRASPHPPRPSATTPSNAALRRRRASGSLQRHRSGVRHIESHTRRDSTSYGTHQFRSPTHHQSGTYVRVLGPSALLPMPRARCLSLRALAPDWHRWRSDWLQALANGDLIMRVFAGVAEADGNRTRQRLNQPLTGFEDRGTHQASGRLHMWD